MFGAIAKFFKNVTNRVEEIEASEDIALADGLQTPIDDVDAILADVDAIVDQYAVDQYSAAAHVGQDEQLHMAQHEQLHIAQHEQLHMVQHETHTLSLEDVVAMLEQARTALNESGIDSDLRDLINHPDADVMIENLQAAGIDPLTVSGPEIDDQSPEDQIISVLEAAQFATYKAGLDMPQAEQDMPEAMQSTSFEYDYTNANDDYGIA